MPTAAARNKIPADTRFDLSGITAAARVRRCNASCVHGSLAGLTMAGIDLTTVVLQAGQFHGIEVNHG
jgi:hypothetical protein